jgi:hypothetical protein
MHYQMLRWGGAREVSVQNFKMHIMINSQNIAREREKRQKDNQTDTHIDRKICTWS